MMGCKHDLHVEHLEEAICEKCDEGFNDYAVIDHEQLQLMQDVIDASRHVVNLWDGDDKRIAFDAAMFRLIEEVDALGGG